MLRLLYPPDLLERNFMAPVSASDDGVVVSRVPTLIVPEFNSRQRENRSFYDSLIRCLAP